MRNLLRMKLTVLGVLLSGWMASSANADIVMKMQESGNDVVFNYSGTLDLTGMTFFANSGSAGMVNPGLPEIVIGTGTTDVPFDIYRVTSGIAPEFGTASSSSAASSGSGDVFGFSTGTLAIVPDGYVSNSFISGTSTFSNHSFDSLDITSGNYSWSFNNSAITLSVASAVPEPSSLMLFGVAGIGLLVRRKKST